MSKSIKILRSRFIKILKEELNMIYEGEVVDLAAHPKFRGHSDDDGNDGDDSYVDPQQEKTKALMQSEPTNYDDDDDFAAFLDSIESGKVVELPDEYGD